MFSVQNLTPILSDLNLVFLVFLKLKIQKASTVHHADML